MANNFWVMGINPTRQPTSEPILELRTNSPITFNQAVEAYATTKAHNPDGRTKVIMRFGKDNFVYGIGSVSGGLAGAEGRDEGLEHAFGGYQADKPKEFAYIRKEVKPALRRIKDGQFVRFDGDKVQVGTIGQEDLKDLKLGMGNGAKAAIVIAGVAAVVGAIAWMRHRSKVKAEREMENVNVAAQSPSTEKGHGAALS